jgi:hypothetical protein
MSSRALEITMIVTPILMPKSVFILVVASLWGCSAGGGSKDVQLPSSDHLGAEGGGAGASDGHTGPVCTQAAVCEDCKVYQCGTEVLASTDAASNTAQLALNSCFEQTCDFPTCVAKLDAIGGQASSLAGCLRNKCTARCPGISPSANNGAAGGAGGTGEIGGTSGHAGQSSGGGSSGEASNGGVSTPMECKALSDACASKFDSACGAPTTACLTEAACSAALNRFNDCLNGSCGADCLSALESTSPTAKAFGDCLATTPGCQ